MNKVLKKSLLLFLLIITITLLQNTVLGMELNLNALDFNIVINKNGNMDVTETWNINMKDVNTLYKTFKINRSKHGTLKNISVMEVEEAGSIKHFNEINQEMYHVTKDSFYGLINSDGAFEIAWGVSATNSQTRIFKIQYTVEDAITLYNDTAELYWQFIGEDFEVPAKKVVGKITLPSAAENIEDLKIWAHGQRNGEITKTNNNTVSFKLNNYTPQEFVEIRIAMPINMFSNIKRVKNIDYLNTILTEETKWAEEANTKRQMNSMIENVVIYGIVIVSIITFAILLKKSFKYSMILRETPVINPIQELEYFRDISDEATPADSQFLFGTLKFRIPQVVSATMLNLVLKKYLAFEIVKNNKNKEEILVKFINLHSEELSQDEVVILEFFKEINDVNHFTMKDFEKYVTKKPAVFEKLSTKIYNATEQKHVESNNFDKEVYSKGLKWALKAVGYIVLMIISFVIIPVSVLSIINTVLCFKISGRLKGLTQKGVEEKEKFKGLQKFIRDFSLLDEKELPDLILWEKYLVFATVFGIADKVIKQLKISYPQLNDTAMTGSYTYLYLITNNNFGSNAISSINRSVISSYNTATYSSGSGAGGGFSGGGGGGRWWRRWRWPLIQNLQIQI